MAVLLIMTNHHTRHPTHRTIVLAAAILLVGCALPPPTPGADAQNENCTFVAEECAVEPCQVSPEAAAACCADEGAIQRVTPPGRQIGDTIIVQCVVPATAPATTGEAQP
jgi:hypothetical protein